jgi:hypothetical protein
MSKRCSLTVVSLVLCVSTSLLAWEMDLHYGLTKWLAFQAGFNLDDAEIIARGTQDPDEGKLYPAPSAVFAAACLGRRDEDRVRLVQTYHFPSYGPIPGLPSARSVEPGSSENAATALVEKEIQTVLPSQPRERTLEQLGVALHPLEDSWSHQGEPDIPLSCSQQLAYGHPAKRGGWLKHDADLTYLHQVPDTIETAHRTYDKLVAFLANHPKLRDHQATPWNKLEPQVTDFAKAGSKREKLAWFQNQKDVPLSSYVTHPNFLQSINLPDSPRDKSSLLGAQAVDVSYPQGPRDEIHAPTNVEEFVDEFLTVWIVKRIPQLALKFMNPNFVAKPFSVNPGSGSSEDITRSILDMWLVRDHGMVNLLGHGTELSASTWQQFEKLPQIEGGSLQSAIVGIGDRPYEIFPLSEKKDFRESDAYAVVFQFRHAPRDAVALILVRDQKNNWSVNGLLWWTL